MSHEQRRIARKRFIVSIAIAILFLAFGKAFRYLLSLMPSEKAIERIGNVSPYFFLPLTLLYLFVAPFSFFMKSSAIYKLFNRACVTVFFLFVAMKLVEASFWHVRFPIFSSVAMATSILFSIWLYTALYPIPNSGQALDKFEKGESIIE